MAWLATQEIGCSWCCWVPSLPMVIWNGNETAMHRGAAEVKHEFYFFRNSIRIPKRFANVVPFSWTLIFIHNGGLLMIRLSAVTHRCSIDCWSKRHHATINATPPTLYCLWGWPLTMMVQQTSSCKTIKIFQRRCSISERLFRRRKLQHELMMEAGIFVL